MAGTVLRHVVHERGFTCIANTTIRDTELTLAARGLLATMLSLPEDWQFSAERLAEGCPDGRDAIRTAMRRLEEHGYLVRRRERRPDGTFTTVVLVAEDPSLLTGDGNAVAGPTCGNTAFEQVAPATGSPTPVKPSSKKDKTKKENPGDRSSRVDDHPDARSLVDTWWENTKPRPMVNYMAAVKIVSKALASQWSAEAIARALPHCDHLTAWQLENVLKRHQRMDAAKAEYRAEAGSAESPEEFMRRSSA